MSDVNIEKIAVGYCRVSTDDQAKNGLSIEVQEKLCKEAIKGDGFKVLKIIKDEGKSAGTLNRAGIKEVMQLVIRKEINAVYTIHSDRIARNTLDHLNLRKLFDENSVLLKCINQPMVDDSAVSRKMDTVMASFNEMQRLITSEKVKATGYQKVEAGHFPSIPPPGYKNADNPNQNVDRLEKKIIIQDKDSAPLIKEMFELYSTGNFNVYDLRDILYEKGLRGRKGKKMSRSRMYDLLRNKFYLGEIKWGPAYNKNGKHKPIIDESLFKQVQRVLESNNKHACRRRKYEWLLKGFLYCYRHENKRYTAEWHPIKNKEGRKKKIAYYHCTNKSGCGKYTEQVEMEEKVASKFKGLEFDSEFVSKIIEKAQKIINEREKGHNRKRQGFVNQRTALSNRKRVMEDKLLDGIIADEDFRVRRKEFDEELNDIEESLSELEQQKSINVDITKEILGFTKNIYKEYKKASPKLKRYLLGFFWEKFDVCDGVIIKSNPTLLFNEILKLEKIVLKNQKTDLPKKLNVSNKIIINDEWLREQDSNLRPSDYTYPKISLRRGLYHHPP